jgi:hypothetical protein
MDQGGDDVLEDQPIRDPLAVAAERMRGDNAGMLRQQGRELDPKGFEQGCWEDRHGCSSITEVGTL